MPANATVLAEPFPFLLAGPILRSVGPKTVTVWVALSKSSAVTLKVYSTGGGGHQIQQLCLEGQNRTIKLGTHLHVTAVTAQLLGEPLQPGQVYAYDLRFLPPLTDQSVGLKTATVLGHASVSYFAHQLPTFALPPATLNDLKIVHGSCRKPHGSGSDILPVLDDLIAQDAYNADGRPHQLFLTGDQIYGDDVADPFLWIAQQLGPVLMGWEEVLPVGKLANGTYNYQNPKIWKPGQRAEVARQSCGFTAMLHNKPKAAKSHLFSFTEYCVAYLLAWSPMLWPDPERILSAAPPDDHSSKQWYQDAAAMQTFVNGVSYVRRALANVPTYMICDDHDISDDWYLNRDWCNRVLSKPLGRCVVQNGLLAYAIFQAWGNTPEQFANDQPGAALLRAVEQWSQSQGKDRGVWQRVGRFLGMPAQDGTTGQPQMSSEQSVLVLERDPKALNWFYTIRSACHEVLVVDTRTWRGYPQDLEETAPPMLLCPSAFGKQIEAPLRQTEDLNQLGGNIQATFIVLPTNLITLSIVDQVQRWAWQRGMVFSTDVGDSWNFNEAAFTQLLSTLSTYRDRIVLLSGDIHYGSTVRVDYWTRYRDPTHPYKGSIIVQLTSSAMKNAELATYLVHTRLKSLFPERSESWLGWRTPPKLVEVVITPDQVRYYPLSPVEQGPIWRQHHGTQGSPNLAWGVALADQESLPDWQYRMTWIPRQKAQSTLFPRSRHRSPSSRSHPLAQCAKRAVSWLWHNRWFQEGSEVVGHNNFGVVTWEGSEASDHPIIVHNVYWYPPWNATRPVKSRYRVPLTQNTVPLIPRILSSKNSANSV